MDKIRGYKITGEVAASSARLYLAKRWGKRYVLKEFRHYRFPVEESEACPPMLSHVEQRTQAFYDRLQHQAQYVRKHVREDGLLNVPLEVFRQGKMIYKVTRQIDDCGIGTSELHEKLTPRQMAVLLRSILLQLQSLERIGFIHGDMKPENVVVTCFGKTYVGSVIDFDTGYIAVEGPGECVEFTPEYASPEMHLMESLIALPEEAKREAQLQKLTRLIARQTFGTLVENDPWNAPWLSVSLASAAEMIAYRHRKGDAAYETRFFEEIEVGARLTRPAGVCVGAGTAHFGSETEMTQVLRDQGAAMLLGIEQAVGENAFLDALRLYADQSAGGVGSLSALEEALFSVTGCDWSGYLEDELSF